MSYWTGAEGPIVGPKGPQPSAGTRNKRAKRAVFLVSIKGPSQDNSDYAATDKTLNNISEGISTKNGQVKKMVTMQPLIKH